MFLKLKSTKKKRLLDKVLKKEPQRKLLEEIESEVWNLKQ